MTEDTVGRATHLPRWALAAAALAAAAAAGVMLVLLLPRPQTGQETRCAHAALPGAVDPLLYELAFRVDVARGVFAGDETVHLRVHRAVDTVSFHAVGLDVPLERIRFTVRDGAGPGAPRTRTCSSSTRPSRSRRTRTAPRATSRWSSTSRRRSRTASRGSTGRRSAAARLGWDRRAGEDDRTTQLRGVLLARLAHADDARTRDEALRRFRAVHGGDNADDGDNDDDGDGADALPTDQRALVYTVAARHGTPADVDALFRVYRGAVLPEERVAVLRALGAVADEARARAVLAWAADAGEVRTQDVPAVLAAAGAAHPALVWAFVRARWAWVEATFAGEPFLFRTVVTAALGRLVDDARAAEAERFFAAHPAPAARRALQQCLETIRTRAAWYRRAHEDVLTWLTENGF